MIEISLINKSYQEAMDAFLPQIRADGIEEYHIDFEADYANSKIIRDFVGAIFDANDIHVPWRGRFVLIADELINNAIEHGSAPGDMNRCLIVAGTNREHLFTISVEVQDSGNGEESFDRDKLEAAREETKNSTDIYLKKRGRGLFHITEKLVDRLTFRENELGGLTVKIEKSIPVGA